MTRVAVIPACLALLPEYRSQGDPVADLRAAVDTAVAWLGAPVAVVASGPGARVAAAALDRRAEHSGDEPSILVTLNGSASRTPKAPAYFDPRAEGFDDELRAALLGPDAAALRHVDAALGSELGADLDTLGEFADLVGDARLVSVDYDDARYGVQFWAMRWQA